MYYNDDQIHVITHKTEGLIIYRLYHAGQHIGNVVQDLPRIWKIDLVGVETPLMCRTKRQCIEFAEKYVQDEFYKNYRLERRKIGRAANF